jgi:hypothetical protein
MRELSVAEQRYQAVLALIKDSRTDLSDRYLGLDIAKSRLTKINNDTNASEAMSPPKEPPTDRPVASSSTTTLALAVEVRVLRENAHTARAAGERSGLSRRWGSLQRTG